MPFIYIILPTIFRNGFINYVQSYLGAIWLKKNGHSSPITQFSSPITNYSITHFLSLNNEDISHSARLAPITQLCFQPKKLKKLGPTHWPNVIRLFSLIFFFFFPWLSPFSTSHLSLPLPFVFLCFSSLFFPLLFSQTPPRTQRWKSRSGPTAPISIVIQRHLPRGHRHPAPQDLLWPDAAAQTCDHGNMLWPEEGLRAEKQNSRRPE